MKTISGSNLLGATAILVTLIACGSRPSSFAVEVTLQPQTAAPATAKAATATIASAASTTVPATATAIPEAPHFPTPDVSKFPKDAHGRVLGGNQPIINYAPDMVTGKPCPRVKTWQPRALEPADGSKNTGNAFYVPDNPCVVQNAIDDFVEVAWAIPYFNDREGMLELERLYETDPVLIKGIARSFYQRSLVNKQYQRGFAYRLCNLPIFSLIDPNPSARLDNTGKVIEVWQVDVAQGLKTASCQTHDFVTGKAVRRGTFDAEKFKKEGYTVFAYWMFWSDQEQRWQLGGLASPFNKIKYDVVNRLYEMAKYKP